MNAQILVLFTDGQSVFLLRRHRLWTLPDTAFLWPLEKRKGSIKETGMKCLKIASLGVIDISKLQLWSPTTEQIHNVFGLSENYRCVVIQCPSAVFDYLCQAVKNVYTTINRYSDTFFEPSVMSIESILQSKVCSLETIHCTRAFLDTNK